MKRELIVAVLSAGVFSVMPALAQQAKPAAKATPAKQEQPNVAEFDKQMAQVQENMKKMQEQMDKIRQTQDPKERQKLLEEHWTTMQSTMGMMHGMWGRGMMGGPMRGGHMMGGPGGPDGPGGHMMGGPMMGWGQLGGAYSKLTPEQMKQRQYMMDQYMGMQQMMMDNMMQHQHMWMPPQSPRQPSQ